MNTILRRLGAITAAFVALGLAFAGPAAAAGSSQPTGSVVDSAQCAVDFAEPGVNIRSLPNTGSVIRGQGNPGDCMTVHRMMQGENIYCPRLGIWDNLWFDATNERTGVRGWVSQCYAVSP